ncbi:alr0857 family protein [Altericista sp. CCNU0014]|uniref:alr0857 family protein n=1 Tax=Altericista sp. CCNU0014 TaxID=3082949 RepID=UPI00384A4A42
MLKLTYTETGFRLERLKISLELWVSQRVSMTLCAGQTLYFEPSKASFLLPAKDPGLFRLEQLLSAEYKPFISFSTVDDAYVEVSLKGSWIAESMDAHEGIFIATFSNQVEFYLHKLWQSTQAQASFLA